jgi:hypothetical protein
MSDIKNMILLLTRFICKGMQYEGCWSVKIISLLNMHIVASNKVGWVMRIPKKTRVSISTSPGYRPSVWCKSVWWSWASVCCTWTSVRYSCTSGWCGSASWCWFRFIVGIVGTLWDVPFCGLLVEAPWAVRTLDVIGVVRGWRWRQVRSFPSSCYMCFHLFCSTDGADEFFMLLTPIWFLRFL